EPCEDPVLVHPDQLAVPLTTGTR
ncbi:MAG: hypothetical protein QOC80_2397, partial [Frankiaceae bacterium]|nr:hypothetical protein [Frankiaceae bacterium]